MDAVPCIYEVVVWLPQRDEGLKADVPALFLIKPTTPYLLNKHHLMVKANVYWVRPMHSVK